MGFETNECSTCGIEVIDPVEGVKASNEWVFAFVTHNKKKACLCRLCYNELEESISPQEDDFDNWGK